MGRGRRAAADSNCLTGRWKSILPDSSSRLWLALSELDRLGTSEAGTLYLLSSLVPRILTILIYTMGTIICSVKLFGK